MALFVYRAKADTQVRPYDMSALRRYRLLTTSGKSPLHSRAPKRIRPDAELVEVYTEPL
jgi:hypothetical protein